MPIRSPTVVSQHLSKNDKRGWLTRDDRHRLSPILYDTAPLFVYLHCLAIVPLCFHLL